MKLAVIRFNSLDNIHIVDAIASLGYTFFDVFLSQHIQIESLGNDDSMEVYLKGVSIKDFDRILYFNTPDDKDFYLKTDDEKYMSTEFYTALIAVLKQREHVLINGKDAFVFNQLLQKPIAQTPHLNDLGWLTPSISTRYEIKRKKKVQFKMPDPDTYFKYYFIATQKRFFLFPNEGVSFPDDKHLLSLFEHAKDFLAKQGMEWLVIPFIIHEDKYYGFGLTSKIPYHLENKMLNTLIKDILS